MVNKTSFKVAQQKRFNLLSGGKGKWINRFGPDPMKNFNCVLPKSLNNSLFRAQNLNLNNREHFQKHSAYLLVGLGFLV